MEYKQYIKTKLVGTDTLVVDGYVDWQADKYDPTDTLLSGTTGRHFQTQLTNVRGQYILKVVSGQMVQRTQTELDTEWNSRPIPPDPDAELTLAITNATTLDDLKKALTGTNGKLVKAAGKMK